MLVKQAANVLEILEYFAKRRRPATLSEVADELGWPRSSAFNLLGTLADKGFLYEPRTRGGYYPSPRWLSLVQTIADAEPLPEAAYSLVAEIAEETGETTAIGAPAGTSALFIHVVESNSPIRYFAQVGHKLPIHASSTGRAILAQYSRDERYALYRKISFQQYSETTPTSMEAVEAELRRSAERGWHQSLADFSPDLVGVALPLPIQSRRLSLVVAGPMFRCRDRIPETAAALQRAVRRFSDLLELSEAPAAE
ncbi:IclR family transcriptional regulator [Phreatobacter stygius]|uniref:IclR family transcriptional regulator n=1 Tax=Phreatobacter stygius TaxID=1940610 RepID=A0A4D7BB35_9HYPH|nr:IclR family transcriptional regulator [Phreatobacter stygius]QCI65297.1 IclR family transcriptional regulator [Phreatobacter stygius]